jgi:hypothetical protein
LDLRAGLGKGLPRRGAHHHRIVDVATGFDANATNVNGYVARAALQPHLSSESTLNKWVDMALLSHLGSTLDRALGKKQKG